MKKIIIFSIVIFLGLFLAIYQYYTELRADFAIAYSPSKPANGHSWAEMECTAGLCVTTDNKVGIGTDDPKEKLEITGNIKNTGSVVTTGNIDAVGDITAGGDICAAGACLSQMASFVANQPLINNVHNQGACTAAGGEIIPSEASYPQCRFSAATCPSGWTWYKGYSKTVSNSCGSIWFGGPGVGYSCGQTCTSSSHNWSDNSAQESCTGLWGWGDTSTWGACCRNPDSCGCTAVSTRTQIGCY